MKQWSEPKLNDHESKRYTQLCLYSISTELLHIFPDLFCYCFRFSHLAVWNICIRNEPRMIISRNEPIIEKQWKKHLKIPIYLNTDRCHLISNKSYMSYDLIQSKKKPSFPLIKIGNCYCHGLPISKIPNWRAL